MILVAPSGRGDRLVSELIFAGNGPLGARRMIRVGDSAVDADGSGGFARGVGPFGSVTGSTGIAADV
ncbi:hypothetical protein [Mycobacterium spongiae]|uniref:hypothetical protein n=1 Tax=Mycobacterium spongiae TaxID=886343 RepID=UPI001FE25BE7|nr:hypothetical protein [Mycobacterium spongiae]